MSLKGSFEAFCNSTKKDSKTATTKTITKIFKDCKLYNKTCTTTDTDIAFSKMCTSKKEMTFELFKKFLEEVAPKVYPKNDDAVAQVEKAIADGAPKAHGATASSGDAATKRLTDASGYTGSHKERFDESGKGKGIEGRVDRDAKAAEGYVGGYKGQNTYDKTH